MIMISHRQVCVIIKHSLNYARDKRTNFYRFISPWLSSKENFAMCTIEYQHAKKIDVTIYA